MTQSSTPDLATTSKARRSKRILEPARLKILGESRVGTPQVELTSAVTINCHGCLYLSRHEHRRDSWMTLEVSNQHTGAKSAPVRAKVRFVRLPRNPRELYRVGVELETPANIWGIESVPEDWLPYSDSASRRSGRCSGRASRACDDPKCDGDRSREAHSARLQRVRAIRTGLVQA
jgi:hypothetical protein